jgi:hypothetical protein
VLFKGKTVILEGGVKDQDQNIVTIAHHPVRGPYREACIILEYGRWDASIPLSRDVMKASCREVVERSRHMGLIAMAMNGTVLLCIVNAGKISLKGIAVDPRSMPKAEVPHPSNSVVARKVTTATCGHAIERMSDSVTTYGSGGKM